MGAPGEYVEDELRPVYYLQFGHLSQFPDLRGGELLVEDEYRRVLLQRLYDELLYLARPHEALGVQCGEPLADHVEDYQVVGPRELLEFFKRFHLAVFGLGGDAHEYRPLPLVRHVPCYGAAPPLFPDDDGDDGPSPRYDYAELSLDLP